MHAVKLDQRALDSFHALRVEPFLKLISIHHPTFDPRNRAFHYTFPASTVISQLLLVGHINLAVLLRDRVVTHVAIAHFGNRLVVSLQALSTGGKEETVPAAELAAGLDLAIIDLYLPQLRTDLARAERYANGLAKLVYRAPELLLNVTRGGVTYRVRTDMPPIDAHLLQTLDRALSGTAAQVVAMRISRSEALGPRREQLTPAQVVERHQPLRPLAIQALSRFLSPQA